MRKCLTCVRSENCELQKLSKELNVNEIRFDGETKDYPIDDLSSSIVRIKINVYFVVDVSACVKIFKPFVQLKQTREA